MAKYYGLEPRKVGDYTIGVEKIAEALDEVTPLWEKHYEETELAYMDHVLVPDLDRVLGLESRGLLVEFTIRDHGVLVGHLGFFIGPNLHVAGTSIAKEDWFYVLPEHRKGRVAIELLAYAEASFRELGITFMGMSDKSPCGGKSLDKLLTRRDFQPIAIHYLKDLSGESNDVLLRSPRGS